MQRLINACIQEALKSDCLYSHGAIAFKGGKIFSKGHNSTKSGRILKMNVPSIHAECACMRGLRSTKGMKILVLRVGRGGELRLSKPCSLCRDVMMKSGIHKVYYSDEDGDIISTRLIDLVTIPSKGFWIYGEMDIPQFTPRRIK